MTKYIKIIFTLSILLNLTLMGVVGAGAWKKYQSQQARLPQNPEIRTAIRHTMRENRDDLRENMKDIRQHHTALKSIIEAQEFDVDAYNAQVSKMLESKNEMSLLKAKAMGQTLSELSYEDRQEFARHAVKSLSGPTYRPRRAPDVQHGDRLEDRLGR